MPDVYVAPAARVLTVLHRPDPDGGPGTAGTLTGEVTGWTACGTPMMAMELWMPVERREGDAVCWVCEAEGRAGQDVQEALL